MKYKTIYIDPPWKQQMTGKYSIRHARAKNLKYPTMSLKELEELPIKDLFDVGCHIWLWTTNQYLRQGFDLLDKWGFKYLCPIHWKKPSGIGNYFIHVTQTMLFGYYQRCVFPIGRYFPNFIETKKPPMEHSRKPVEVYEYIEKISEEPRIEMFARAFSPLFPKRDGWDTWGDESSERR
ncbi:MAG: MT-A70 family methyltransferase [Magnetococcus sp. WYHC-3]